MLARADDPIRRANGRNVQKNMLIRVLKSEMKSGFRSVHSSAATRFAWKIFLIDG